MVYSQAPELAIIFEMLYEVKSQHAIAELINKPPSTVSSMIKRMRNLLQQHENREDLTK